MTGRTSYKRTTKRSRASTNQETAMTDAPENTIRNQIDRGPFTIAQFAVLVIAFLLNAVDGFDVVAMAAAAPAFAADWNVSKTTLGYILSAVLIGMTLGAMIFAPMADVIGRKRLVLLALLATGTSMVFTAFAPQSVAVLVLLRVISGLGIGAIIAVAPAIAAEAAPERFRNLAVTLVIAGYPFGAMIVGPVAVELIPTYGWEKIFLVGGVATFVVALIAFLRLPESVDFLALRDDNARSRLTAVNQALARLGHRPIDELPDIERKNLSPGSVKSLFEPTFRITTAKVWTIFFLGFLTVYFLMSWIPTLFVDSGFSYQEGVSVLTLFNLGGVTGIVLIGLITTRIKLSIPIVGGYALAAVYLILFAVLRPEASAKLTLVVFASGLLVQGAFTGMYAVAAKVYPAIIRSTGIGWAAGLGRTGAIISPIIAGYLLGFGWEARQLFVVFAAPMVFAAILSANVDR